MPPSNQRGGKAGDASSDRNEYIPSFISKQPFYVAKDSTEDASTDDYLEHQRLQKRESSDLDAKLKWYQRGQKTGPAATKWRKGACENCGAMGHKRKDCLEKPRAKGARWTNQDIRADDVVQDLSLGWDAKRDRWNGFDAAEYKNIVAEHNEVDELKKPKDQGAIENGDAEDGEGEAEDDAKYAEETDMGRKQPTSTRNLRLREDTAKYLVDLDLDSAKYDPKSRTMIGGDGGNDKAAALIAEEGFMKKSGDAAEFERAQRYAWESQERGDKNKIHMQANPTQGEFLRKKAEQESETKRDSNRKALLSKYGGEEYFQNNLAKDVAVVESDRFVEYDDQGRIKGAPEVKAKSMYTEDVLINNHTSVWGSWWHKFEWGYACCHSTVKNSYCTGEAGKKAMKEMDSLNAPESAADDSEQIPKQIAWEEEAEKEKHVPNGVDDDSKAALDAQARKRRVEEMKEGVTEKELDDYRRKRVASDDPMAKYLGNDELVH